MPAGCSRSSRRASCKARYGASTLEQAFFTATGSVLEEETEEVTA